MRPAFCYYFPAPTQRFSQRRSNFERSKAEARCLLLMVLAAQVVPTYGDFMGFLNVTSNLTLLLDADWSSRKGCVGVRASAEELLAGSN